VVILLGISLGINAVFIWMMWYGYRTEKRIEKDLINKVGKELSQGGQQLRRYSA